MGAAVLFTAVKSLMTHNDKPSTTTTPATAPTMLAPDQQPKPAARKLPALTAPATEPTLLSSKLGS